MIGKSRLVVGGALVAALVGIGFTASAAQTCLSQVGTVNQTRFCTNNNTHGFGSMVSLGGFQRRVTAFKMANLQARSVRTLVKTPTQQLICAVLDSTGDGVGRSVDTCTNGLTFIVQGSTLANGNEPVPNF